jgi:hypothetical protein
MHGRTTRVTLATTSSKKCRRHCRAKGERKICGIGFTLSSAGNDTNNQFNGALITYGGHNVATSDGELNLNDPLVREAAIMALIYFCGVAWRPALHKLNRGLHAASWIRRPSDQDGLRTRTGERDTRLHKSGSIFLSAAVRTSNWQPGARHELAAECFDAWIDAVELSL